MYSGIYVYMYIHIYIYTYIQFRPDNLGENTERKTDSQMCEIEKRHYVSLENT